MNHVNVGYLSWICRVKPEEYFFVNKLNRCDSWCGVLSYVDEISKNNNCKRCLEVMIVRLLSSVLMVTCFKSSMLRKLSRKDLLL